MNYFGQTQTESFCFAFSFEHSDQVVLENSFISMEIGSEQVDKLLLAKKNEPVLTAYFPLSDHIVG